MPLPRFRPHLAARRIWVLCAGLVLLAGCSSQPASAPATAGPLVALVPSGQVDWPVTFSWSGTSADSIVRIRIFDEAERQVFGLEARGTVKEAPPDLKSALSPGRPYQWRVARVDENGQEADASALTTFSLRVAP